MSVLAAPRQPRAGEDAIKTKVRELTHKAPESAQVALNRLCCKVWVTGELLALDDARGWRMNDFKGRYFEGEIVLWAVRW